MLIPLALSFMSGCATKSLKISEPPPRNPGVVLPVEVRVEAKDRHAKLSGELLEWDEGILLIQADHLYKVRTDQIKRLEIGSIKGDEMVLGCLAGVGASAVFWIILILIL